MSDVVCFCIQSKVDSDPLKGIDPLSALIIHTCDFSSYDVSKVKDKYQHVDESWTLICFNQVTEFNRTESESFNVFPAN